MDQKEQQALSDRIISGLSSAQEARRTSPDQFNIDNWVDYWRAISTNPTNQWYNTSDVRETGKINSSQNSDPSKRVSINYIAQEVLNMVASDLLNPLRWRVRFKFFDPAEKIPINQAIDGEPLEMDPDKYLDRINDVMAYYLSREKLNINDARLRIYGLRYKEGSAYITLDWDADGGPRSVFPKRKNGEKWDVLSGEWSEDGQFFKIPRAPLKITLEEYDANPGKYPPPIKEPVENAQGGFDLEIPQEDEVVPSAEFDSGESFREDVIPQGDPKIAVYGVTQVWWDLEPGEISADRIRGVYIVDYITEAQAKEYYAEKIVYGIKEPVEDGEFTKKGDQGVIGATMDKIKNMVGKGKESPGMLCRVRYRRKPNLRERRSQWFTVVGKTLVRAAECQYGKSFDVSLGVYPFFARPSNDHLEGIPDIAYMYQAQIVANAIDSMILEFIESFPYGSYTTIGQEEPNTNVTAGGGPKIITSDRPLTQATPVGLGQEVFTMKGDMRYIIQYFGRSNQLQPGTRSQDANTATQASIAQAYGQKLTSFNQFNDAGSWQMFLNDLLSLLGQFVKERRQIRANTMQSIQGPAGTMPVAIGQDFDFTSAWLEHVDSIICEPEDLQRKTDEESKRDLTAMMQVMNPADPAEAELLKKLKKRYVELMNEPGIEYPSAQVAQPGAPVGPDAMGDQGPGLAIPTPSAETPLPPNMPAGQKEALNQIQTQ